MKKQLSILSLGLLMAGFNLGFSQERIIPCATDEAMNARFAEDPEAKKSFDKAQAQWYKEFLAFTENHANAANRTAAVEYTIPVVFHILHMGGAENIPDATCMAALKQVNEDYARQGADTNTIFTPFKSLYIPSDIKFMLARKDPDGNCTNGIVRHIDPRTNWSQTIANSSNAAGNAYYAHTWDPTRYLNIYIVANIVPQGTVSGNGVIVGYTFRPNTWPAGNPHDAIVYRYNYLTGYQARSLSHEIGHWLSLIHTFGDTNNPGTTCGSNVPPNFGDLISDTPDTKGNYGNCPASSTNSNVVCTSGVTPYYQNVENFMDYSSCPKNFTTGQTNAMRFTLGSTTSGRNNVVSGTNLGPSFTDVNAIAPCAPVAEYMSTTNSYTICVNGSITMQDYSYNGAITNYQWAADNGAVIASPNSSVTGITFNTIGVSNVTLTVSNGQGSSTRVRTVNVVSSTAGILGPYMESFENPGLPFGWSVIATPSSVVTSWQQTSAAAYDGTNSYYVSGPSTTGSQVSILQMPIIDLLNNQNVDFSFAYAYARKSSTWADFFRVQFSKDCGYSWTDVVIKNSANMSIESGGGTSAAPYFPGAKSEWAVVDVTADYPLWFNFTNSSSVLIRFTFEEASQGGGNNFFLDAIDFSGVSGVNELTKSIGLKLYPNPTTGEASLKFTLSQPSEIKMNVVDILGKEVIPSSSVSMEAGDQTLSLNKGNALGRGVYFVNLSVNGAKMSRKLVVD